MPLAISGAGPPAHDLCLWIRGMEHAGSDFRPRYRCIYGVLPLSAVWNFLRLRHRNMLERNSGWLNMLSVMNPGSVVMQMGIRSLGLVDPSQSWASKYQPASLRSSTVHRDWQSKRGSVLWLLWLLSAKPVRGEAVQFDPGSC